METTLSLISPFTRFCAATGKAYEYEELLNNELPREFVLTLAAMLELALHTFRATSPDLVTLCPAWRLLLICQIVVEKKIPALSDLNPSDPNGEYHDWQDYVGEFIGWPPWELIGIFAAHRNLSILGNPSYPEVPKYLASLGKVLRVRSCVEYLQQIPNTRGTEWFDFATIRLKDSVVVSPGGSQAGRLDYVEETACAYYATSSILSGSHWDFWWKDMRHSSNNEEIKREVAMLIYSIVSAVNNVENNSVAMDNLIRNIKIREGY